MHFFRILLLVAPLTCLVISCGTKKVADNTAEPAKSKDQRNGLSKKDFAYIEKFHEGVRLKTRKQYDEALKAFTYCTDARQDDDAVYFAMAEIYRAQNNIPQAATLFARAAELDPKNRYYLEELANIQFEQGEFEKSSANFQKLVKLEPDNVQWLYAYAETLLRSGKTAESIAALDKLEEQVGMYPELTVQKYQMYMSIKLPSKAIAEVKKGLEKFPDDEVLLGTLIDHYFRNGEEDKAIALLAELVKADPQNGRAHLILGQYEMEQQNPEAALKHFQVAFASDEVELDTKIQIALRFLDADDTVSVAEEELARELTDRHPESAVAWSVYGDFMVQKANEAEALRAYRKALEFEKSEFAVWNQVLMLEYQSKNFKGLYETSQECLTYFPTMAQVYLFHALAANQLREFDEALATTAAGKEFVVNDPFLKAEILGQEAEAWFGLKDYPKGKETFETALKLTPNNYLLTNNYAYQLALAGEELDRAEELIRSVLGNTEEEAYILDTYGYVLFRKKDYQAAYEQFEKAYAKESGDATITEHLGDAAIKTGRTAEALKFWKMAKEQGSTNKKLDLKIEKQQFYEPEY